ncbi:MAG TPA: FAD-dependent oxidoreductase, partial [Chloroflexota bacterium]|nr:FAD-dependent oxidoreductase [Chloroflexota bacterium]
MTGCDPSATLLANLTPDLASDLKGAMSHGDHSDLIVIGTGAAGSSGWQKAAALGKRVTVFERAVLGGECPTFACIPTKTLLHC